MILRFATSEPGGIPSGIVLTIPMVPLPASQSMLGVAAFWRTVKPPISSIGLSAIPSPMMTTYFI